MQLYLDAAENLQLESEIEQLQNKVKQMESAIDQMEVELKHPKFHRVCTCGVAAGTRHKNDCQRKLDNFERSKRRKNHRHKAHINIHIASVNINSSK